MNWVVAADQLTQETTRLARRLANGPPWLWRGESEDEPMLDRNIEAQLEDSSPVSRVVLRRMILHGRAFVEKRKPEFRGN